MKRLAQYALVVWAAMTVNFALPRLAPGDPLQFLAGVEGDRLPPADERRLLAELGLDRPLLVQYGRFAAGVARGDLGRSIRYGRPVAPLLVDRLARTALLVIPSLLVCTLGGTMLGALAAWRRGRRLDMVLLASLLALDALPAFWIAMVLIAVFAARLHWFPAAASVALAVAADSRATFGAELVLPLVTLALAGVARAFLVSRAAMLTALDEEYMLLAEAKGLTTTALIFRHALPNAILPIVTNATLGLTAIVSGAVVVETVFAYPGIGRLVFEAVSARDYPLLQGAFFLLVVGVVGINWLTDVTCAWLDPRARGVTRASNMART